jgi:glycolate oxidase
MNAPNPTTTPARSVLDALTPDIVITDPDIVAGCARDQSRFTGSAAPAAVLAPHTTGEVSA